MAYSKDLQSIMERYISIYNENSPAPDFTSTHKGGDEFNEEEAFKIIDNRLHTSKMFLRNYFRTIGLHLRNLAINLDWSIDTMAVDAYENLYINPKFAAYDITQDEFTATLAHEVHHYLLSSFDRQLGRDNLLWNVATDYVINKYLEIYGLKLNRMALIPVLKNGRWIADGKDWMIPPRWELNNVDITDLKAEQIYNILEKNRGTGTGKGTGNETGKGTGKGTGNETGKGTGNETGNETGKGTGNETGKGTGNETGKGTGNETGKGTGKGTGNETGKGTGNETGKGTGNQSNDINVGDVVEDDGGNFGEVTEITPDGNYKIKPLSKSERAKYE